MDGKDITKKEINSHIELEQPSVCANPTLDNTLLEGFSRNNENDASVINLTAGKTEGVVGSQGTADPPFCLTDGQVLSNSNIEGSEKEVGLESYNESESPPLTEVFNAKVTESLMTDKPTSVDEVVTGFPGSTETPSGEELKVDSPWNDGNSGDKPASLDNQKRKGSSSSDDGEIMDLNLENAMGNGDDSSQQDDLESHDNTFKEENAKAVADLHKADHVDSVALKSSENNRSGEAVSSTEKTIPQTTHSIHQREESIDSSAEDDLRFSVSEQSSIVPAGSRQAHDRSFIDTVSDSVKNKNVGDNFGNSLSDNGPCENIAEELTKETEKKQVISTFNEHHEELDYEENDGDDGCGRPGKFKEDQENTQDGQSDKDEGELTDDDCEEGEIKEPGNKKLFVKPVCRFFQRGNCTWGVGCRFLHPGVNDKGNYQLIEMPGCAPVGIRARLGVPVMWPEQKLEEEGELPPPPVPNIPLVETAWERGLRLAKERKKAAERKEKDSDFEDKRLNLSVDNDRELNKENERLPTVTIQNPYYDQPEYEVDEYYKVPREPWPAGHYENHPARYNQDRAYPPPYRDKPPATTSARYDHLYGPPEDKFDRERLGLREPIRLEAAPVAQPLLKRPDEWTDPWSRSKSPKHTKRKAHRTSRGSRNRRSASDYSRSSRSRSRSSGSSRSSRSYSSSGSSSPSRSAQPAPPGLDRRDRYPSPPREQARSSTSARSPGAYDGGYYQNSRGNGRNQRGGYHVSRGNYQGNSSGGGSFGPGPAGGHAERNLRGRSPDRIWRKRGRSPPDRPLPYVRPRPRSASSNSDSSRSRSKGRIRISSSRSRSSSRSSSSSSSSSAGSADSDHLYRDLGNPPKNIQAPASGKKSRSNNRTTNGQLPTPPTAKRNQVPASLPAFRLDQIPTPQDPKPPLPASASGKVEPKYASRNAPPPPVKAKDPLKVVGQKSNIKLTLLPKSSLGSRPNPLDSPPHKRQLLDSDISSPESPPPAKQPNLTPEASVLRLASEKAAKLQSKAVVKSVPVPVPQPASSSSSSASSLPSGSQVKHTLLPQKQQTGSVKSRAVEPAVAKTAPKALVANVPTTTTPVVKAKKNAVSRREELLKQLKAVEDAIAKKKGKLL